MSANLFVKTSKMPALILAAGLQLAPLGRVACLTEMGLPTGVVQVCRWLASVAAVLGTFHAVSGASAAIAGVANTSPPGPVTTNATGSVGQPFSYRIIVTNPGINHAQDYWNAVPLPAGLTINTNAGGNGWITGTPTVAGAFAVTLTAGNLNSDIVVHKDITITIQGGAAPPSITGQPANQIVSVGANVSFSVVASGAGLGYQWRLNSNDLAGPGGAVLTLTNVTAAQSGSYSVVVTNTAGAATSREAQLLVVPPPDPGMAPRLVLTVANMPQLGLTFDAQPGYRYALQSAATIGTTNWVTLTNWPAAFVGGTNVLPPFLTQDPQQFYRLEVRGN